MRRLAPRERLAECQQLAPEIRGLRAKLRSAEADVEIVSQRGLGYLLRQRAA